jgi:hypothetical protein
MTLFDFGLLLMLSAFMKGRMRIKAEQLRANKYGVDGCHEVSDCVSVCILSCFVAAAACK